MGGFVLTEDMEDWEVLMGFLPSGWRSKAKELGAVLRYRKFLDAEDLLRTLLIHLAEGCSLRVTAAKAKFGNIASVSDVALLKRLNRSGEWFRWMALGVMKEWFRKPPTVVFGNEFCIRLIDGSTIQEPGSTGTTWRLHYSIQLPSLRCDEVYITSPKVGESFNNFRVHGDELFIADRGYCQRSGINHVINNGADVLVRMKYNLALVDEKGEAFGLFPHLRTLRVHKLGDWDVRIPYENRLIAGRICAIKKSRAAAERARREIEKEARKKGRVPKPETLEAAGYTFVFTTLRRDFSATKVLEMYRGRWQIELAFKRLKSILGLGHLKKTDIEGAKAWIHGKLLVAFLMEAMIAASESFFPWGYPLQEEAS